MRQLVRGSVTFVDLTQAVLLCWSTVVVNQGLSLCIGFYYFKCLNYSFPNCGGRVVLHL